MCLFSLKRGNKKFWKAFLETFNTLKSIRHEFPPRFRGTSVDYMQEIFKIRFRACYVTRTGMFVTPYIQTNGAILGYLNVISYLNTKHFPGGIAVWFRFANISAFFTFLHTHV